jgi:hypothetical protein
VPGRYRGQLVTAKGGLGGTALGEVWTVNLYDPFLSTVPLLGYTLIKCFLVSSILLISIAIRILGGNGAKVYLSATNSIP